MRVVKIVAMDVNRYFENLKKGLYDEVKKHQKIYVMRIFKKVSVLRIPMAPYVVCVDVIIKVFFKWRSNILV